MALGTSEAHLSSSRLSLLPSPCSCLENKTFCVQNDPIFLRQRRLELVIRLIRMEGGCLFFPPYLLKPWDGLVRVLRIKRSFPEGVFKGL